MVLECIINFHNPKPSHHTHILPAAILGQAKRDFNFIGRTGGFIISEIERVRFFQYQWELRDFKFMPAAGNVINEIRRRGNILRVCRVGEQKE